MSGVDLDNPSPECASWARLLEAATNERNRLAAECRQLRTALHAWRNWSDEVAPPFGSDRDRSDDGQRTQLSAHLAQLTAERDEAVKRAEKAEAMLVKYKNAVTEHLHVKMNDIVDGPNSRKAIERDTAEAIAAWLDNEHCGRDDDPHDVVPLIRDELRKGAHRKEGM